MKPKTQTKNERAIAYRRGLGTPEYNKRWGRIPDAVACSGLNKGEIYQLIKLGLIESYVYKARPDAKGGSRLVNLESLNAYLDKRSEEARKEAGQ